MKITWKCNTCNGVVHSDTKKYNALDYCGCGASCIDAEDDLIRVCHGDVDFLDSCMKCGKEVFESDLNKKGNCKNCKCNSNV